jgi:hypothetical protein
MSDEQRKDEEAEVEGHHQAHPPKFNANDEPEDEVEGHLKKFHANDEDDEVEGHLKKWN